MLILINRERKKRIKNVFLLQNRVSTDKFIHNKRIPKRLAFRWNQNSNCRSTYFQKSRNMHYLKAKKRSLLNRTQFSRAAKKSKTVTSQHSTITIRNAEITALLTLFTYRSWRSATTRPPSPAVGFVLVRRRVRMKIVVENAFVTSLLFMLSCNQWFYSRGCYGHPSCVRLDVRNAC